MLCFFVVFCVFFLASVVQKIPRLLIPYCSMAEHPMSPCRHVLAVEINQVQLDQPGRRSVEIPIHSPEEAKADKSGKSEVTCKAKLTKGSRSRV